jgi:hypothetical protein
MWLTVAAQGQRRYEDAVPDYRRGSSDISGSSGQLSLSEWSMGDAVRLTGEQRQSDSFVTSYIPDILSGAATHGHGGIGGDHSRRIAEARANVHGCYGFIALRPASDSAGS